MQLKFPTYLLLPTILKKNISCIYLELVFNIFLRAEFINTQILHALGVIAGMCQEMNATMISHLQIH